MSSVSDDFDRPDESPIGGNWTSEVLGSPPLPAPWGQSELFNGRVYGLGSFSNPAWRNDYAPGADCYVQARAYGMPWPGVFARLQPGEGTAYFYMWPSPGEATLYRFVGGSSFIALLDFDMSSDPLVDGDLLRMEIEGTGAAVTIRVYKNGVLLNTAVDTDPLRIVAPGKVGVHTDGIRAAGLDNFKTGTLTDTVRRRTLGQKTGTRAT